MERNGTEWGEWEGRGGLTRSYCRSQGHMDHQSARGSTLRNREGSEQSVVYRILLLLNVGSVNATIAQLTGNKENVY